MAPSNFSRNFDANIVLNQRIKDAGKTHVFFINGINVNSEGFATQKRNVGQALNLLKRLPNSVNLTKDINDQDRGYYRPPTNGCVAVN